MPSRNLRQIDQSSLRRHPFYLHRRVASKSLVPDGNRTEVRHGLFFGQTDARISDGQCLASLSASI